MTAQVLKHSQVVQGLELVNLGEHQHQLPSFQCLVNFSGIMLTVRAESVAVGGCGLKKLVIAAGFFFVNFLSISQLCFCVLCSFGDWGSLCPHYLLNGGTHCTIIAQHSIQCKGSVSALQF